MGAVSQAYDAVGLGDGTKTTDPTENDVPTVQGELSLIVFVVSDGLGTGIPAGSIAFVDPFDPEGDFIGLFADPNALAGPGSQLTSSIDGTGIWFVNQQGQLSAIDLSNADASSVNALSQAPALVAEGLFIEEAGDISNASIGPIAIDDNGNVIEVIAMDVCIRQ